MRTYNIAKCKVVVSVMDNKGEKRFLTNQRICLPIGANLLTYCVSSLSFEIIRIQKTACARSLSYRSKTFQRGSQCGSLEKEDSKMKAFNSLRIYINLLSTFGASMEIEMEIEGI